MNNEYQRIPQCGWPCRLLPEDTSTIDLNDGSCVKLQGDVYVWYDIDGGIMERFERGTTDFEVWTEVHNRLKMS